MARSFLLRGLTAQGGMVRDLVWRLEGVGLGLLWTLARSLPPTWASALGAFLIGRTGPLLDKQRHVLANLRRVRPQASYAELHHLSRQVWANAGRVLMEVPHVRTLLATRTDFQVHPELRAAVRAGQPLIFTGGHLGNWELLLPAVVAVGGPCAVIYAPLQNPWLDRQLRYWRQRTGCTFVEKQAALRPLLRQLQAGRNVGLLPDQRVPGGTALPLFGEAAETTLSPVKLAQRSGALLVPLVVERLPAGRFRVQFLAPVAVPRDADPAQVMQRWQGQLQQWIDAHPEQWLCTKRRWAKRPAQG